MVPGKQWTGGLLALLTGALALGLWIASTREEPPPPASARPSADALAGEGAEEEHRAGQEANAFAQQALEALRAAGFRGELRYDAERFLIQVPEVEGQHGQTIFLNNFYDEYRAAPPERRAEALRRITLLGRTPEAPDTYAEARKALLPVVRPRAYFELLKLMEPGDPIDNPEPAAWRPLGEVLAVAIVQDTPDAMKYVGPKQLEQWGVSFEQVSAVALENLRGKSHEPLVPLGPGTCASPWRDSYAPSRLLLEEVLRRCPVRGDPVVLAPNRDFLIITGSEDEEGLLRAGELALNAWQAPRPLDGRALRRSAGGWVPFLPARSSQAWPALYELAVSSQGREYASQRDPLERQHQRAGVDLFVADLIPYKDEHGRTFSQTVWVSGIDMMIPRADVIYFMDSALGPKSPPVAVVRWEVVERDVGPLLAPVEGLYPVRYRPQGFPSKEQLARWKADPRTMDVP